jgi:hypothetical protein
VGIRFKKARARGFLLALAVIAAVILLGATPRPGQQGQAMLPAFVLARLRLYGKVPVLY